MKFMYLVMYPVKEVVKENVKKYIFHNSKYFNKLTKKIRRYGEKCI